MPAITVIVPVYNVEQYLRRCIDSILKQSFQDFELVCVNDCSPDGSMEIVDEFVSKYPEKIKRIDHKENMGLGAARDRGIQYAQGKYIVFFDSDDYVKEDYLEIYLAEMEHSGADIVMGGYVRRAGEKETVFSMRDTPYTPWLYPAVWMRMYRRSFLQEHNLDFRQIRIYEDNPFNYRCMLEGARVSVIDYCGYYYICNPSSITRAQNGAEKYYRFVNNFRTIYEEYRDTEAFRENQEALEYVYLSAILSCMLLQCHHSGKENAYLMYQDYKDQMEAMFPNYRKNRQIGLCKLKEEQKKVRFATGVYFFMERIGLGKLLIRLLSV